MIPERVPFSKRGTESRTDALEGAVDFFEKYSKITKTGVFVQKRPQVPQ